MGQILAFQAEKLSAPIEILKLDQRAYHMLRRAGIREVSDIILRGEIGILTIKNIGQLLQNQIISHTADFLGISVQELFCEEIRKESISQKGDNPNASADSISDLALSYPVKELVVRTGITQIKQLISSSNNDYENIRYLGSKVIREIDKALLLHLTSQPVSSDTKANKIVPGLSCRGNSNVETDVTREDFFSKANTSPFPTVQDNLSLILSGLGINKRTWLTLELRADRLLTLQQISTEIGGVTRSRSQQIINQAVHRFYKNQDLFSRFMDYFEQSAMEIKNKRLKDHWELNDLVNELKAGLLDTSLTATDDDLVKFIRILRILNLHKKGSAWDALEAKWENTIQLCCLVVPPIQTLQKYQKIEKTVKKYGARQRELSYKELGYAALAKAKRPMHWSEIASHAYELSKRKNFDTTGIYHALLNHTELFVRVGQGTYELVEWGGKQAAPYPEIIASILEEENRPIPYDLLMAKVSSVRTIKQQSFLLYLELHPRFYKSINNLYGLRGWLPPREKQNLRTPEWLIEDSKSYARVERARQRGYDIENLVSEDQVR
jgi:DNA-directed RNA polymerase delta subunit